jgi:starch synthase
MNILLATSEVHPYSKTGGLADMVGALAKTLARAGHQARIVTPLYRGIHQQFPQIRREDWWFDLPLGDQRIQAELFSLQAEENLTIYFVRQQDLYDRNGLYMENNVVFADNAERFIFFSKCVAHLARYLPWRPDIVHIHDWQTGLVPALLQNQQKNEGWGNPPPTCLTIHNLAYQGVFPPNTFEFTNLPREYFTTETSEYFGHLNCLKAGVALANMITTVSPRYAREILTEEYGCGLDGLLRKRQARLVGILNGVDYEEWNAMTDPYLKARYSATRLAGKKIDKEDLQKDLGLAVSPVPLFGTITRLAEQKGIDIQLAALEEMLSADMQFVMLGAGSPAYEHGYHELARRFPNKVAARFGYNESLSHRIEAGCDFYIMPSRYEPSGLNQMYSLRYGTIPIVRATGGLDDSVVDYTENKTQANGIKFSEYSPRALCRAVRKALALYAQPALLTRYRKNAMKCDFSWERTVGQYLEVYETAKVAAMR